MKKIWRTAAGIDLADRFLMIFMMILFGYMIAGLPGDSSGVQGADTVDVIVRTSAAAVFGYFMSSSFGGRDSAAEEQEGTGGITGTLILQEQKDGEDAVKNRIGFQTMGKGSMEGMEGRAVPGNGTASGAGGRKVQIVVVASVGILSLAVLIGTRHFGNMTPELTATVSQLRDFVSGCIGFLISCAKDSRR